MANNDIFKTLEKTDRKSEIRWIQKIRNFDFLNFRNTENEYYKRIFKLLKRYKEDFQAVEFFSEHIFKIDTNFEKHKRFIIITKEHLY